MSVITSTPGQIQVIKRTGDVAAFDAEKISVAIGKAFLAVEGQQCGFEPYSRPYYPTDGNGTEHFHSPFTFWRYHSY